MLTLAITRRETSPSAKKLEEHKNTTTTQPTNSTSGHLFEVNKTLTRKDKAPCVHGSVIYNRQDLDAAQVSISRWVDKDDVVYIR